MFLRCAVLCDHDCLCPCLRYASFATGVGDQAHANILHVGCGNSLLGKDLADAGAWRDMPRAIVGCISRRTPMVRTNGPQHVFTCNHSVILDLFFGQTRGWPRHDLIIDPKLELKCLFRGLIPTQCNRVSRVLGLWSS